MKNRDIKNKLLIFVIPFIFLVVGIITLKDYGLNWDEPYHFAKGQAALHYMLTGKKTFLDLPAYTPTLKGSSDFMDQFGQEMDLYLRSTKSKENPSSNLRRSYYQSDVWTYEYLTTHEIVGHPEVNDLLAAFSNFVFYQKLKIMGDIESHHFFEVIASFLIVLAVSVLVYYHFGAGPSLVTAFALSSYPPFFSESHFNVKDPPLAAFFGITIITFYFGIIKRNWKLIFLSATSFALGVGTKFNAFFAAPIIILWLVFYLITEFRRNKPLKLLKEKRLLISLILFPLISSVIFFALSPTFWPDPLGRLAVHLKFYSQIGVGTPPELTNYLIKGWNTYPAIWFLITTPIPVLLLTLIGILASIYGLIKKKKHFYFLLLLWFFVPFLRATIPNTNIYGGIRQIIEFAPAMAVLAGVGANALFKIKNYSKSFKWVVATSLIFVLWEVYSIHPNENVYFNQLIGGLSGAKQKNIPYWGNTFGNVYLQGVDWMNKNAEENAKFGLPIGSTINIPRIKLRDDIDVSNSYLSGPSRLGEYEMELYFDWPPTSWYRYAYHDAFLNPVHQVEVDGVPLLKIWKNDMEHTKKGFVDEVDYRASSIKVEFQKISENLVYKRLLIDMGKELFLTRVTIKHSDKECLKQKGGYIAISSDAKSWFQELESIDSFQVNPNLVGADEKTFVFLFPANKARYILIDTQMDDPCILKNPEVFIRGLKKE